MANLKFATSLFSKTIHEKELMQRGGTRAHLDLKGTLVPWVEQTFNARNLDNNTWKEPIETRRGIAVMSGIGESRVLAGRKTSNHYLMLADKPFFIGVLWKAFPQDLYSTAVITREKQIGFEKFHDKAFPLFLPYDKKFIDLWLDLEVRSTQPEIAELLAHPTWFCDLHVTRVKTFIRGELYKESVTETLKAA